MLRHDGEELSEELLNNGTDTVVHALLVLLHTLVRQVVKQDVEGADLAGLQSQQLQPVD